VIIEAIISVGDIAIILFGVKINPGGRGGENSRAGYFDDDRKSGINNRNSRLGGKIFHYGFGG